MNPSPQNAGVSQPGAHRSAVCTLASVVYPSAYKLMFVPLSQASGSEGSRLNFESSTPSPQKANVQLVRHSPYSSFRFTSPPVLTIALLPSSHVSGPPGRSSPQVV